MKHVLIATLLLPLMACGGGQTQATAEVTQDSVKNQVVETIMTRRSIRQYKPEAVAREKMQTGMRHQCAQCHEPPAVGSPGSG